MAFTSLPPGATNLPDPPPPPPCQSCEKLRVAIIGQSSFAGEVYKLLRQDGHTVVGVFTVPDQGSREDPVGTYTAAVMERGVCV